MFWNEINEMLNKCEDKLHHDLFNILTSHIEESLEENELSEHDREVLKKVYDYMYRGEY